jgi:hypothetical protein
MTVPPSFKLPTQSGWLIGFLQADWNRVRLAAFFDWPVGGSHDRLMPEH